MRESSAGLRSLSQGWPVLTPENPSLYSVVQLKPAALMYSMYTSYSSKEGNAGDYTGKLEEHASYM